MAGPSRKGSALSVLAGLLVALPIVAVTAAPAFNRLAPTVGGMPFFYWYLLLWVVLAGVLTGSAYVLLRRVDREQGRT